MKSDSSLRTPGTSEAVTNFAGAGWEIRLRRAARWLADREWLILFFPISGILLMGRIPLKLIAATLVLIPIPWLCRCVGYGYLSVRTPLDLPILIFLLMNVQGLYPSTDLRLSLSVVIQDLVQVALFYGVVNGLSKRRRTEFTAGGLLLSAVVVAIGSLGNTQWNKAKLFTFPQVYSFFSRIHLPWLSKQTFQPNFVGAVLAMLSPLGVAILWSRLEVRWRALAGASLLIMLPVLALTQSRGAFLGLTMAFLFIVAYRNRLFRWAVPVWIVVVGLVVYRVGVTKVADIILTTDVATGAQGRMEVWSRALYMIQDFPYTGIGPGTYGIVASVLYPFFLIGPNTVVAHPHNIYLGAAVDFGLPGLVAFIALITVWLLVTVSGLRRSRGMEELEVLFLGLLAGFIVYLVHGMVDQVTFSTKTGAILWAMMGLAVGMWLRLPGKVAEDTLPVKSP